MQFRKKNPNRQKERQILSQITLTEKDKPLKIKHNIYFILVKQNNLFNFAQHNFNFIQYETAKKQNNCSSSSNSTMLMLSDRHPK
jgi:hypothetical protein